MNADLKNSKSKYVSMWGGEEYAFKKLNAPKTRFSLKYQKATKSYFSYKATKMQC